MGPGNNRFFPLHFYTFFCLTIHFLYGKTDKIINTNIDTFLASFFTIFLNCNPQSSALKNRRFAARSPRFLTHVQHASHFLIM